MSDSMIERVAKAIESSGIGEGPNAQYDRILREAARAAIEAMREPTERMISAGQMYEREFLDDAWRDMIDEALAEKP